ncbi:MAG: PIN domain-containing protein [Anaerolineales bacterium]|nr:PIN domain-containing protein [Anaerolineales bacterium]
MANKPRVFIDADVLFAGAASPNEHSASLVILRMAEITLIEAIASQQVITEAERNLQEKMPAALPAFQLLASRCLRVVADPTADEIKTLAKSSDPKELPILAAAAREACAYLVTYNVRHYQPGVKEVTVLKPGDLTQRVRYLLSQMSQGNDR